MKEAILYEKLSGNKVRCQACNHFCEISEGKRGICGVRENQAGKLYSLVYGKACAENVDPIEKKPFYHFLPGTSALSIATVGCNFRCDNCQNWSISQLPKIAGEIQGFNLLPEDIVKHAITEKCPSIAYTYTEPTVFIEYALDTMKSAKKKGIKNLWVSNGFMSSSALKLIIPYLDAINIDLKSFFTNSEDDKFYVRHCGGRVQPILDNLKVLKRKGVWVEVTTLVIPTLTDDPEMLKKIAKFIYEELSPDTPWHVSRFSGAISWKMQDILDTPVETVLKAKEIGERAGLKYVHAGNI